LIDDEEVLSLIKNQADSGRYVSVTHQESGRLRALRLLDLRRRAALWGGRHSSRAACHDALGHPSFAALLRSDPGQSARRDRRKLYQYFAGVTAGLDGAFEVASILRDDAIAEEIQLDIEYAPEPLFNSGSPETASAEVIRVFFENYGAVRESRDAEARRFATKVGVALKS
jgi:cyclohexyl-isocyanide hydratase